MVFRSSFVAAVCSAALFVGVSAQSDARFVHAAPFTQSAQFTQSSPFTQGASKDELCSLVPGSYAGAKQSHPDLAFAIDEVTKHSIATWYSDRNADYETVPQRLVSTCPESSRLSVVVYGLPNKDCEAGYSSTNSRVQNKADYVQFLQNLINTIENRKVLYVLEPDAVGLLAKEGGCGEASGYRDNLKTAIQMLSRNPNAEIYLDVGYWTLAWPEPRQRVVEVIQNLLSAGGRVKGITLNTSNFRKTSEIAGLCSDFQQQMGSTEMNCIVDTSRNYRGSPSSEWCNVGSAGIGHPPTSNTGMSNIDYFLWIKPAGESDGSCEGGDHTADATRGPAAGEFFVDGFKKLWDLGYFVDAMNMPSFASGGAPSPAQTPAPTQAPTQAPTPDSTSFIQTGAPQPEPTTQTPSTPAPEVTTAKPEVTTPAPEVTTAKPDVTTPAPEVTTAKPATTTPAPEATTAKPATTTPAPEATTAKPATTTPAPEVTISKPDPTTAKPESTTPAPASTTPTPTATTVAPSSGATDVPSITPKTTSPSASSSSGSSNESPAPRPSFRPTKEPKTKAPKTPSPEIETPAPNSDIVQKAPAVDAGPSTIGGNPIQANTKSGATGSSGAGAVIAAVLIVAVAMAVAAAVFIHIRRRKQDATADDMKTPVSLDPAHPAYMSQL